MFCCAFFVGEKWEVCGMGYAMGFVRTCANIDFYTTKDLAWDVPLVIFYCLMFVFIWLPHEWCERVFIWITLEIRCCLFYSSFQTWMSAKSTCVHMVFPSKFEKYIVTPERMELDYFYGILIEFSIEFTLISVQE